MLRDRNKTRLVVRRGVDGREPVRALWKAIRDLNGHGAVRAGPGVDALEEGKGLRVQDLGGLEGIDRLDDKVGVADDVALAVDLLRGGIVVLLRVHEVARLEVADRHLDRERRVGFDGVEVGRLHEFGRGHVRAARDHAHRGRVARTALDLLAVGDRLVDGSAKVDKVVDGGQRSDLAGGWRFLAVLFEAFGDHARIQGLRTVGQLSGIGVGDQATYYRRSVGRRRWERNCLIGFHYCRFLDFLGHCLCLGRRDKYGTWVKQASR